MTTAIFPPPDYPHPKAISDWIAGLLSKNQIQAIEDLDDWVYSFISDHYDHLFTDDSTWFSEDDTDMKDQLRDEVLELLDYYCNA